MDSILSSFPITRFKLFIARILFFIIKPIYGTKKRIIKRNGISFEIDITEGLDLSLFLFGNFQKHVSENKYLNLPKDAVIFDVGANVGIMSLNFAKQAPKGKVFAFEPTHFAMDKLTKNLELKTGLASVIQVVQTFISCEDKIQSKIKAFSSWKINKEVGSDQHPIHGGKAMSTEGVQTTTIDEFVKAQQIDRLDFIKIDTDGHEFDVLLGARTSIEKFKPQIIFELGQYVMEERGIKFKDYERYFSSLNYKLSNAVNNQAISDSNFKKLVPEKGTIDVLALPK
jgi:FkbM family methyltransferase